MAQKRTSTEAEAMPLRTRRGSKRTRLSPAAEVPSDSSEASNSSISEASALKSTPGASEGNRQATMSPISSQEDETSESDISETSSEDPSSEEDDEDEEEDEEEIVTLGGPKKPAIDPQRVLEEAAKLQSRLQELMPKLRQANKELAEKGPSLNMEEVGENEEHIEMDLGLGVLEEKTGADEGDALKEASGHKSPSTEPEGKPDAIQSLLGAGKEHMPPGIEEVDGV